jgi:osmoprotectant transport system permease protein
VVIGVGTGTLVLVLAVLGIPPILTNAFTGIRQVDRASVDAARGAGMTEFQILRKIELPLAVPSIMQGVRGASVNILATATIAPLVGVAT